MESVVLVIHLFLALAIIGLVLLQRSEGGGLGIGGGGGGLGNVASAKGMDNLLTRLTTICAIAFFCTSLLLGILAGRATSKDQSIMDALELPPASVSLDEAVEEEGAPAEAPDVPLAQ